MGLPFSLYTTWQGKRIQVAKPRRDGQHPTRSRGRERRPTPRTNSAHMSKTTGLRWMARDHGKSKSGVPRELIQGPRARGTGFLADNTGPGCLSHSRSAPYLGLQWHILVQHLRDTPSGIVRAPDALGAKQARALRPVAPEPRSHRDRPVGPPTVPASHLTGRGSPLR